MGRSKSRSRSGSSYSRSRSKSKGRSYKSYSTSNSRSRSRSQSRSNKKRRRKSYSRSYSKSYSRSRSRSYHSKSRSPYRRSRSRSPYRRRGGRSYGGYRRRSPLSNRKRHVGDRDAPPQGKCLGIFGLSLYTTEREVREICDRYGDVDSCQIVYDHATGRSRGFAFVYFKDVESAIEAKDRLNGQELDGRRIRVDFSITQRAHTPTPGVYMGRPTYSRRDDEREDRYASRSHHSKRSYSRSRSRSPRRW